MFRRQKDPVREDLRLRAEREAREKRRQRLMSSPVRASGVVDGVPVTLELRFVSLRETTSYERFSIVLISKGEETILKGFARYDYHDFEQRAAAYFEQLKVQYGLRE